MDQEPNLDQAEALRLEAGEARRLAECMSDDQSVADLERYAAALETEALSLELKADRGAKTKKGPAPRARVRASAHSALHRA